MESSAFSCKCQSYLADTFIERESFRLGSPRPAGTPLGKGDRGDHELLQQHQLISSFEFSRLQTAQVDARCQIGSIEDHFVRTRLPPTVNQFGYLVSSQIVNRKIYEACGLQLVADSCCWIEGIGGGRIELECTRLR